MRRMYALVLSFALLIATPGLASADPYVRPARNQQAIDYVLTRALAQRGVPFSYGGGDATGPTLGSPATPANLGTEQLANTAGTVPGNSGFGTDPVAGDLSAPPAPSVVGFDASGLVVYAFSGVGIKLPRSSGQQYAAGQKVLPSQALPGDLIFYGPEGTQSVAMFVGNGQMLEATTPVVKVSPVRTNGMAPYLVRVIA